MLGVRQAVSTNRFDRRLDLGARGVQGQGRSLPGSRARLHRLLPSSRHPPRALRERLPRDRSRRADGSHAWAEAFVSGQGFTSFDVANRLAPAKHHVKVAIGMDYSRRSARCASSGAEVGQPLEVEVRVV